jgi:hypothetical protein
MTFPLAAALVTVKAPDAYSFWASMMISAESDGDAVLAGMPKIDRKDCAVMVDSIQSLIEQVMFPKQVKRQEKQGHNRLGRWQFFGWSCCFCTPHLYLHFCMTIFPRTRPRPKSIIRSSPCHRTDGQRFDNRNEKWVTMEHEFMKYVRVQ